MADLRVRKLNHSEIMACMDKLMDDFIDSFQETGNLISWKPPIEAVLLDITR